jgi:hypothetical protein
MPMRPDDPIRRIVSWLVDYTQEAEKLLETAVRAGSARHDLVTIRAYRTLYEGLRTEGILSEVHEARFMMTILAALARNTRNEPHYRLYGQPLLSYLRELFENELPPILEELRRRYPADQFWARSWTWQDVTRPRRPS